VVDEPVRGADLATLAGGKTAPQGPAVREPNI
jgi:hypothetical protein